MGSREVPCPSSTQQKQYVFVYIKEEGPKEGIRFVDKVFKEERKRSRKRR